MSRRSSASRRGKRRSSSKKKRGGGIMSGMRGSMRTVAGTNKRTASGRSKLVMNLFTVALVLVAAYVLARRFGWI